MNGGKDYCIASDNGKRISRGIAAAGLVGQPKTIFIGAVELRLDEPEAAQFTVCIGQDRAHIVIVLFKIGEGIDGLIIFAVGP